MRSIPLTQGEYALIDDEDYEKVKKFRWRVLWRKSRGNLKYAYARKCIKGKQIEIAMHRLIMGAKKNQSLDHINHNGIDNRKCNLRFATQQQNMFNSSSHKNSSSKFKGVFWYKRDKKWISQIKKAGKAIYLGIYYNEIIAAWAYDQMAKKLFKEYAKLNLC